MVPFCVTDGEQPLAQRRLVRLASFAPIRQVRLEKLTIDTLHISLAVLDDQHRNALGMLDRDSQPLPLFRTDISRAKRRQTSR